MYRFNDASNAGVNIYDRWIQSRTLFLRQPITDEIANLRQIRPSDVYVSD
jgi:hypothetical protein